MNAIECVYFNKLNRMQKVAGNVLLKPYFLTEGAKDRKSIHGKE